MVVFFSFDIRGNPWIGSSDQPERDKHARDIPFLDKYSMERWEVQLLLLLCQQKTIQLYSFIHLLNNWVQIADPIITIQWIT